VRELQKGRIPAKLSQAALETLAIVAYKQPIVRTEIESVRGVDSSGVLATLLKRSLVTIAGRAPGMGRALMYRTTKEFLRYFGLNSLTDLPRLQEFAEVLGLKPEELESTLAASEALAEEIVFRGLPALWLRAQAYPLASAAAFAAIHWESGTREVVAAFLLGVGLAALYLRVRNLWPFVAGHAVTDMLAFTGTYTY